MFQTLNKLLLIIVLLMLCSSISYAQNNSGVNTIGLQYKWYALVAPTGTPPVSQVISLIPFKPKAIIFFPSYRTGFGASNNACGGIGMSDMTNNHSVTFRQPIGFPAVSDSYYDTTKCINYLSFSGDALVMSAYVSATDSAGFTLTWTKTNSAFYIACLILGGDDIDSTFLETISAKASGGSQSYSNFGVTPSIIFTMAPSESDSTGLIPNAGVSFGYATSDGQYAGATLSEDGASPKSNTAHVQHNNKVFSQLYTPSSWTTRTASLTSMDASGYTLNWTNNSSTPLLSVLSIKGGKYAVNWDTLNNTSNTLLRTSYTGTAPEGVLFSFFNSNGDSSLAGVIDDDLHFAVCGSSRDWVSGTATSRIALASSLEDNSNTTADFSGWLTLSYFFAFYTNLSGTATLYHNETAWDSLNNNGLWASFSSSAGTALEYGALYFYSENKYVAQSAASSPLSDWNIQQETKIDETTTDGEYLINYGGVTNDWQIGNLQPFAGSRDNRTLFRQQSLYTFFDTYNIPDSLVDSIAFYFYVGTVTNADTAAVHRVNEYWAEGSGAGSRTDDTTADANYVYRDKAAANSSDTTWTTSGGDFQASRIMTIPLASNSWVRGIYPDSMISTLVNDSVPDAYLLKDHEENANNKFYFNSAHDEDQTNNNYEGWATVIYWHDPTPAQEDDFGGYRSKTTSTGIRSKTAGLSKRGPN